MTDTFVEYNLRWYRWVWSFAETTRRRQKGRFEASSIDPVSRPIVSPIVSRTRVAVSLGFLNGYSHQVQGHDGKRQEAQSVSHVKAATRKNFQNCIHGMISIEYTSSPLLFSYFLGTFIIWTYLLKFACLSLMKKLCWLQQNLELDCKWTLVHMDNLSTSISFASKIGSMFIRCTIVWLIFNRKNRKDW